MIYTEKKKKIKVHFTPFRDGLQSSFGGKVRLNDFLPAMKAAKEAGINHMEFGGGARYQAPLFYLNEDPFETMKTIREEMGDDVDLQILTRSVSGVTLTNQSIEGLTLQAKLMKKYGTTYDRNFDFMNDVTNLINTGKPIVEAGMHHQVCIALMGLPFDSDEVHTAEYYINVGKQLLESGMHIDSICLKDASGTTNPKIIYDAAIGLKKIMPSEMPLWMHTHDTASMAVACYMAGIAGGVDGVDLSIRPMASGTVQPDVRSVNHALKGTGYSLDIDVSKMNEIEGLLNDGLSEYHFNPTTTTADARVLGFPMPGGAIGPNVHMMEKAGILDKYSDVLAEFPVVVKAGGAWTSVTPGSQQYWLQAFNNVMFGRWERIDMGYGKSALGYFGKTPLPADPEVVKIASKQLDLPPFDGDPLAKAENLIPEAEKALKESGIDVNEKNTFLVLSAMVPGKKIEANEGIRFLKGNGKIDIPLKKAEATVSSEKITSPVTSECVIDENGVKRKFKVTIGPADADSSSASSSEPSKESTPIFSTFAGSVVIVDVLVKVGQQVEEGETVVEIEAMKAKFEIKSSASGVVDQVFVAIGDEIDSSKPIMTIR